MRYILLFAFAITLFSCKAQPKTDIPVSKDENSLLWKISGNNIKDESFLYGTFHLMCKGDIVFSRVGSIDRSTYVTKEEDGWMFSGRCIRIRSNTSVNSRYLSFYFRQSFFKKMMLNISVGATMPSLNTKLICSNLGSGFALEVKRSRSFL